MNIPALLFLVLAAPGSLLLGIWTLRRRAWYGGVPLVESLIDRVAGVEPSPRTTTDRRFARFHAGASIAFGIFFSFCLMAVVVSFLSE